MRIVDMTSPSKMLLKSFFAWGITVFIMIYGSYGLPLLLPGDYITATYSSSHVALSGAEHMRLVALRKEQGGFTGYLKRLVTFDWGRSQALMVPVSTLIFSALPWTLLLVGLAHLFSITLGFVAGVEIAWRRGRPMEKAAVGFTSVLEAVPEIGTGVILLVVFSLSLHWFPSAGAKTAYANMSSWGQLLDVGHHLVLPLTTLILAYLPGNFLLTRAGMVMVMKKQFVETARAKGLPPFRVRYAHAARNALLPLVTRFGLRIAFMMTGVVVVETIHSYPGLGTLLFHAISMRDLPLIRCIVLFSSIMVISINFILEFVYRRIDPRVSSYAS